MSFLYWLESVRTPILDFLFRFFSLFGEEMLILCVICILLWCVNKRIAYRVGMVFFFSGLLSQGLKISFRIERPWVLDPGFEPVPGSKTTATGYSFPSGHTQGATALYSSLSLELWARKYKWPTALALLLVAGVGLSRMYLGVHTPADVMTSLVLTVIVALITYYSYRRLRRSPLESDDGFAPSRDLTVSIVLAAISVAVGAYSIFLIASGTVPVEKGVDCVKSAGAGLGFAIGRYVEMRWIDFETRTSKLWQQIVKAAVGLGGALAIKEGLKYVIGTTVSAQFARYFIVVLWVLVLYPMIFKAILNKNRKDNI